MTTGGLVHVLDVKSRFIHAPNNIIKEQFTPYFDNLKQLAHEWRALVRAEDNRRDRLKRSDQLGQLSNPLTHRGIVELLCQHADRLTSVGLLPQMHPNTPPPPHLDASQLKRPPLSLSPSITLTASTKKLRGDDLCPWSPISKSEHTHVLR